MSFGNIYSVDVQSPFTGDVLAAVQSAIQAEYGIDDAHYAKIVKVDMRSADTFDVQMNRDCLMQAVRMPSGEYGACYKGGIDQVTFAAETTLTWMQVEWAYAGKVEYPVPPVWVPVEPDDGTSAVLGEAILGKMILGKG